MGEFELFKRSGRLFARPSFIEGFSRVFDLGATLSGYNQNLSEEEADREALASDWAAVGDSIRSSIVLFQSDVIEQRRTQLD